MGAKLISRYAEDPTYFPHRRRGKRPLSNSEKGYLSSLEVAERERHLTVRNHPSGRPSFGGANRSSNIRREIHLRVTTVERCPWCGGVFPDVLQLTSLFPACNCP